MRVRIEGFLAALLTASALASGPPTYGTRIAKMNDNDLTPVRCKLRFGTLVVLPKGEDIIDLEVGDKNVWQVKKNGHVLMVKPSLAGATTNLQAVSLTGHVYSFLLLEVSKEKAGTEDGTPDLKVFVEETPAPAVPSAAPPPVCDLAELKEAQSLLKAEQKAFDATTDKLAVVESEAASKVFPTKFLADLTHDYQVGRHSSEAPFNVEFIAHSDKLTYIKSKSEDRPAVYELKDGKSSAVQFDYERGIYIINKVIDHGYLQVGKRRLRFDRKGA